VGVIVHVDAGTTCEFPTGEYWDETNGVLTVYGTHGSATTRPLDTFTSWLDVSFTE
jgi:hypothetical protein